MEILAVKQLLLIVPLSVLAFGCDSYEDKRADPTAQPDFVDTSDPNIVLGQQAKEREQAKGAKKP
jgi:hypothetical protein